MTYEKKKGVKDDLKFVTQAAKRLELPSTELGKVQEEQGRQG